MKALSGISEDRRVPAVERFHLLRPAIEDDAPLTRVARDAGIPLRTVQRWMSTYKREGLAGLARKPRGDLGHCHKLPEQLERIVEGLALGKPRLSMAVVQRQTAKIATRFYTRHRLIESGLSRTLGEEGHLPVFHPPKRSSGC